MSEESEKQDQEKLQEAMFLRYQPQEGRADRLAANLPGDRSIGSVKGKYR